MAAQGAAFMSGNCIGSSDGYVLCHAVSWCQGTGERRPTGE